MAAPDTLIVTTTPSVEGRQIGEYLGVVAGEAILGMNAFKDLFAGIRDIVGGRSGAYEEELRNARELALGEMRTAAAAMGADAIVGIDVLNYTNATSPLTPKRSGPGTGSM